MKKRWIIGALVLAIAAALAATVGRATQASAAPKLTKITLQLKWVPQAQFAGYYAASLKGFYKAQGLDVTLKNGVRGAVGEGRAFRVLANGTHRGAIRLPEMEPMPGMTPGREIAGMAPACVAAVSEDARPRAAAAAS